MDERNQTHAAMSGPAPDSLFAGLEFPPESYWEAFSAPGRPREHWRELLDALNAVGPEALTRRQERARQMRHEDGATFNPFDDPGGRGIPWALETIPLPLTAEDWAALEAGLIQRAHLLEAILADVYGPQRLLQEGSLPAELIYANPRFLRPCHGVIPAGNRFLTFYAADLYRGPDGRFVVLRDHAANPAGLGYALENRIVSSRILPELFHQAQIPRLAPFFQALQHSFLQRIPQRREDPSIVLLSPGPDSRIYFEHALLSRYLGYPLVEGQDLTVRNGRVFLKKLAGLESVEAIFRHLPDGDIDPFALRRSRQSGVAGLIQAAREGQIEVVNPIGAGFAETPALGVFLAGLCRRLLGPDLLLASHPAWWCGDPVQRERVLADMAGLSLGWALEDTAAQLPQDLPAALAVEPQRFLARAPLRPASAPAWGPEGARPRYTMLRIFACATDEGFAVMPGGLGITADDLDTLMWGVPERQQSKDIWVLSNRPVVPFSMMSGLKTVPEFRRSSDLPSRVADHLFWLGRYLERAEGLIRLLRSVYRRISGEARPRDIPELPYLLNLLRTGNTIPPEPENDDDPSGYNRLSDQLQAALHQAEHPQSVVAILKQVQEAARTVRDRLSLDSWRAINRLEGFSDAAASDPLELLDNTLFSLSAFSGLAMESMTRGLGWRFMDMGRRVERAINQAGLLRVGLSGLYEHSRGALEALLEVSDSIITYRARYRTALQLAPVLDLLIMDESNPKSLAFQCARLVDHIDHLPRQGDLRFATDEERMALKMLTSVRLLDLSGLLRNGGGDDGKGDAPLVAFLTILESRLGDFAQQISAHYLSRVPVLPHFSQLGGGK